MRNISLFLSALTVALLLLATGCSPKVKKVIGLTTSGPNEYSVGKNRPLEIPPHFELEEVDEASESSKNYK